VIQAKDTDRLEPKGKRAGWGPANWPHVTVASPVETERLTHCVIYAELGKPVALPLGKLIAR